MQAWINGVSVPGVVAPLTLVVRTPCPTCVEQHFSLFISSAVVAPLTHVPKARVRPPTYATPLPQAWINGVSVPGVVAPLTLAVKMLGVTLSIAAGLVAGKEGPYIHSGGMLGVLVSQAGTSLARRWALRHLAEDGAGAHGDDHQKPQQQVQPRQCKHGEAGAHELADEVEGGAKGAGGGVGKGDSRSSSSSDGGEGEGNAGGTAVGTAGAVNGGSSVRRRAAQVEQQQQQEGQQQGQGRVRGARRQAIRRQLRKLQRVPWWVAPLAVLEPREQSDAASVGTAAGVAVAFLAPVAGVAYAVEEGTTVFSVSVLWKVRRWKGGGVPWDCYPDALVVRQ